MNTKLTEAEKFQLQNILLKFELFTEKERTLELLTSKVKEERAQNVKLFADFISNQPIGSFGDEKGGQLIKTALKHCWNKHWRQF